MKRTNGTPTLRPRLLDKRATADYLGHVSVDTVERLIASGALPIVRLPLQHKGEHGPSRRVLVDVADLDRLIDRSKER